MRAGIFFSFSSGETRFFFYVKILVMSEQIFQDTCPRGSCIIYDEQVITELCDRLWFYQSPLNLSLDDKSGQIHWAKLVFVNPHSRHLTFRPLDQNGFRMLYGSKILTISNEKGSIVFNTSLGDGARAQFLKIPFPSALVLKNNRSLIRQYVEKFNIQVLFTNFTIQHFDLETLNLEGTLIDISTHGLSLKCPAAIMQHHRPNDKIIITSIIGRLLAKKITGKTIYLRSVKTCNGEEFCKMAIFFDTPLATHQVLSYLPKIR
jgi:hypothetical protein